MPTEKNLQESIWGIATFSTFRPDYVLNLESSVKQPINEIQLRFTGRYDEKGRGLEALHFYVNDIDLTSALKDWFVAMFNSNIADQINEQYRQALESHYVKYPLHNETSEEVRRKGEELLAQPLENQVLSKLGDFSHGWSGHLGIVHFIYREIDLPPISVSALIDKYNASNGTQHNLRSLQQLKLIFSSGPKDDDSAVRKGMLELEIDIYRENPLADPVAQLLELVKAIKQSQETLMGQFSELKTEVSTIQSTVSTVENSIKDLESRASNLETRAEQREKHIKLYRSNGTESIHIDGENGDIYLK